MPAISPLTISLRLSIWRRVRSSAPAPFRASDRTSPSMRRCTAANACPFVAKSCFRSSKNRRAKPSWHASIASVAPRDGSCVPSPSPSALAASLPHSAAIARITPSHISRSPYRPSAGFSGSATTTLAMRSSRSGSIPCGERSTIASHAPSAPFATARRAARSRSCSDSSLAIFSSSVAIEPATAFARSWLKMRSRSASASSMPRCRRFASRSPQTVDAKPRSPAPTESAGAPSPPADCAAPETTTVAMGSERPAAIPRHFRIAGLLSSIAAPVLDAAPNAPAVRGSSGGAPPEGRRYSRARSLKTPLCQLCQTSRGGNTPRP